MRSRPADDRVTELTRRRLEALAAELAAARGEAPPGASDVRAGPAPEQRGVHGGAVAAAPAESSLASTPGSSSASSASSGRHAHRSPSLGRRLSGWTGDRMPSALAHPAHLGSAQAGLVLLIVAAGLVLSAWWLLRAGGSGSGTVAPPQPTVVAGASPSVSAATPSASAAAGAVPTAGSSAPTGSAAPAGSGDQIVVDVAGKVRHPGIAVLPAGSRVVDAVRAAGGVRPGVDRSTVNLARPLTDGEQVLVGVGSSGAAPSVGAAPPSASSPGTTPGALVDINTADQTALETLPGVGPVTAQAILQWRTEHGGFTSVDELLEVSGIGDATLAKIAPYVTL